MKKKTNKNKKQELKKMLDSRFKEARRQLDEWYDLASSQPAMIFFLETIKVFENKQFDTDSKKIKKIEALLSKAYKSFKSVTKKYESELKELKI